MLFYKKSLFCLRVLPSLKLDWKASKHLVFFKTCVEPLRLKSSLNHTKINNQNNVSSQIVQLSRSNFCSTSVSPSEEFQNLNSSNRVEEESLDENCLSFLSILRQSVFLDDLDDSSISSVAKRFGLKGLNIDYINQHGIKITTDLSSLIFPFFSLDNEFRVHQFLTFNQDNEKSVSSITSAKSSSNLLFGWSSVSPHQKIIVVVSDPLDVVAVSQETDLPVVSLPCDFTHFSPELISVLKNFNKIIFWLKPEQLSSNTCLLLAQSFGKKALLISLRDHLSALQCLQSGLKISGILKEGDPLFHEGVDSLNSYRNTVFERLKNSEKYEGIKWSRFSALNDILKGHRKGELTIFTGQTGVGKTTFMSEYSLDLCIQGLPTLWASFEVSNERLIQTMISQFAECSFEENIDKFHQWYDKFEKLPLYLLNSNGRRSLKEMFQAIKLYVKTYQVQHVVVDNLQFLMNVENFNSMMDLLRRQDDIFGTFRAFATQYNCHVTLVMHPRKENEFTELNNASISGTAKATQEADNVLILQRTTDDQYLQVTKNRFSGSKGCVFVDFDENSLTFKQRKVNSSSNKLGNMKVL